MQIAESDIKISPYAQRILINFYNITTAEVKSFDLLITHTENIVIFTFSSVSATSKNFPFFKITQKFIMNHLEFHDNFRSYFSAFSTDSSQQNLLVASQKFSVSSQIKTFSFSVF